MKVAVVGAGIGGMTAAAALVQRGIDVEVFEQASALGEVGAGLQMAPNAMKVLRGLGIESEARKFFFEPTDSVSMEWDSGRLRHRERLRHDAERQFGAPYMMGHRADLHAMLCSLVPSDVVHLGKRCAGVDQGDHGARLAFADGTFAEADVVVAADGIHSALRTHFCGDQPARFTNQICWRAIVPVDKAPRAIGEHGEVRLEGTEYFRWIGPTGHVICYPIRAGRFINIFAGFVSTDWVDDSWAVRSSREEMRATYSGWDPRMLEMFDAVDECFKWGIHDREPLKTWLFGRVILLGDAAHPMMPTLAQGAAISMEDGYALAIALSEAANADTGLRAFERERLSRASQVQRQARAQFDNNRLTPAPPPIDCDWIYGYDATDRSVYLSETA